MILTAADIKMVWECNVITSAEVCSHALFRGARNIVEIVPIRADKAWTKNGDGIYLANVENIKKFKSLDLCVDCWLLRLKRSDLLVVFYKRKKIFYKIKKYHYDEISLSLQFQLKNSINTFSITTNNYVFPFLLNLSYLIKVLTNYTISINCK